jgi:hypothetical protein
MASGSRHPSHNLPEFLDAPSDPEQLLSDGDDAAEDLLEEADDEVAEEDEEDGVGGKPFLAPCT